MKDTIVIGGDISLVNAADGDTRLNMKFDGDGGVQVVHTAIDDVPILSADDLECSIIDIRDTSHIPPTILTEHSVSTPTGYYRQPVTLVNPFGQMEVGGMSFNIDNNGGVQAFFKPTAHGMAYATRTYSLSQEHAVDVMQGVTITPSTEEQVISAARKFMTGDIIVEPIPQNYGLVTWNGSVLTIS